jgi:nickel-dependent lactate racemase
MTSPNIVYLDHHSAPRVLFSGDNLIEVDLPVGTRCIYPKPPIDGVKDVDAAIRYAINHPHGCEPLYAKLRPGMKVAIAVDDISVPLPPMRSPDVRERILNIVIDMLDDHGVEDVEIIIALAYHRRLKEGEIRHIVGNKVMNRFWPDRLSNHDAEDADNMKFLGTTSEGEEVELNKAAVESDLVIYVNLNLVPMDGGHKSVGVGLCGGRTLKAHHNPSIMNKTKSYMDPETSTMHRSVDRIGRVVNEKLDVFHIESTVNNRMFDRNLDFLAKNPDDYSAREKMSLRAILFALGKLPAGAREQIFRKVPAPYSVTGIFAGATEAAHEHTVKKCFEQYRVPVEGQADIQITGIPYISPYNVNAYLNPLLVQVLAQGYFHNLSVGKPLLKQGGTLIITHPCSDRFDHEQHAPYVEFFHKLLPETRDGYELHKRFEREFSSNPAYVRMYRDGNAYHPNHAFYMWYWGEAGRRYQGRCIVVGADNEYVPKILGYETAPNMTEAIRMAKETAPPDPQITCINFTPIMITDVS